MIQLLVARGSRPTGTILARLLERRGLMFGPGQPCGVISYGVFVQEPEHPTLNANAGAGTKLTQFQRMADIGVRVPTFGDEPPGFPCLGRSYQHKGGTDIKLYLQRSDLRRKGESDFYVQFIPSETEYRHWIYRGKHLGTYEKVLTHEPTRRRRIGRNYDNGYGFELVRADRLPTLRDSITNARYAVDALKLDFGAVDVLAGEDGRAYVLEVNTAPGVEGPGRFAIQNLADKIARWVERGYPRRRNDG